MSGLKAFLSGESSIGIFAQDDLPSCGARELENDSIGTICEVDSSVSQSNLKEDIYMEKESNVEDLWAVTRSFISPLTEQSFELTPQGVYWVRNQKVGKDWEEVKDPLCGPLRVLGSARDEGNRNWSTILLVKDREGIEHTLTIRMDQLDGEALIQMLRSAGLTVVTSFKAKEMLVTFLQECPPEDVAPFRLTSKSGWHEGAYVLPDGVNIGNCDERYIFERKKQRDVQTFAPSDSHEGWKQNVSKLCIGNSRLMFAICTAFASVLLHILKGESGGFNFVGDSSTGKSTAVVVASSVFGYPKNYVQGWRATANGLELLACSHNDMMLVLDEMGEMSATELGAAAYMLANGQGKQRMMSSGGLRDRYTWRVMILSSGEVTLADHMSEGGKKARAGQEIRLADIPADAGSGFGIFEDLHGFENGADLSNALKENANLYYGTALPLFVQEVIGKLDVLKNGYEQTKQLFTTEYLPEGSSSQVRRFAEKMALVATAGDFATYLGITGWELGEAVNATKKCFHDWIDFRGGTERQEFTRVIDQVRSFFEQHGDSRLVSLEWDSTTYRPEIGRVVHNRAGYKRSRAGEVDYLIMPSVFREEICSGVNRASAIKILVECGMLKTDKNGKPQTGHRVPGSGVKKMYHFTNKVLSDEV